jgi:hypothetical protein
MELSLGDRIGKNYRQRMHSWDQRLYLRFGMKLKAPPAEVLDADLGDAPIDAFEEPSLAEDWDIDGKGTGSYWMKNQWDGKVHDTDDWSRLYNVTTRYVLSALTHLCNLLT